MKIDRDTLPFKAYYFVIYAAMASLLPYLTVYYEKLGLTGEQIGILAALPPLLTFLSAPLFGAITDVTQNHRRILGVSILSVIGGVLLISVAKNFWILIPVIVLYAFFFAPLLPLIDRSVLEVLGEKKDRYGRQRLWGAVGWGLTAPVVGLLVDQWGLNWAFYGCVILLLVLLGILRFVPVRRVEFRVSFWASFGRLFYNGQVVLFFVVMMIGGMGLAMIHNYLFLFLTSLGANSVTMGLSLTLATASELVVMFFSDTLLKYLKARGLILLALVMLVLRLLAYSSAQSPGVVLLIQLLHGPTFAALWMAGVAYVSEIAPSGLGNTAQGLLTGFVMGLGSASGAFLGGILYQRIGFSSMFLAAGFIILAAWIGFLVVSRSRG